VLWSYFNNKDFKKWCKSVNKGEWNEFFDTLDDETIVELLYSWDDDMWNIAKKVLDDDILETIDELLDAYDDFDIENSWIYDITEDEWT